jgi:hypothetical protein
MPATQSTGRQRPTDVYPGLGVRRSGWSRRQASLDALALTMAPAYCTLSCGCAREADATRAADWGRWALHGERPHPAHGVGAIRACMTRALCAHLAAMLCPAVLRDDGAPQHDRWIGLAAAVALHEELDHAARLTRVRRVGLAALAEAWAASRERAAEVLERWAGRDRRRVASRMRHAAGVMRERELPCLSPLLDLPRRRPGTEALRCAHGFAGAASRTCALLGAAASELAMLAPSLEAAWTEPEHEELGPGALGELVFLARAGMPPLRVLACRALAGSSDPLVHATLREVGRSPDQALAATALWALQSNRDHSDAMG